MPGWWVSLAAGKNSKEMKLMNNPRNNQIAKVEKKKTYVRPAVTRLGRVSGLTLKMGSNLDAMGGHL